MKLFTHSFIGANFMGANVPIFGVLCKMVSNMAFFLSFFVLSQCTYRKSEITHSFTGVLYRELYSKVHQSINKTKQQQHLGTMLQSFFYSSSTIHDGI